VIGATLPRNQGRHLVDERLAALESPQPTRPVVVWTDSVTAGALRDAGGDPGVTDLSSTQAVSAAGVFYTYRRLRETAGAPRALVLVYVPESLGNDLHQVYTPAYFESCFVRWDEILDFERTTGRWTQALVMAGNRLLHPPSMVRRASVRRALRSLRSGDGLRTAANPLQRVAGVDPAVVSEQRARASQDRFLLSDISRLYLERIASDADAEGVRLVLMTAALPRSVFDGWRRSGYLDGYEAALRGIAARHPSVRVEPSGRFADVPDEEMYDRSHLKPAPAKRYGERVLALLRAIGAEPPLRR
jgi:hypothetical protein